MFGIGYSLADSEAERPRIVVAELIGAPSVADGEAGADATQQVIATESVRSLRESGVVDEETLTRLAEASGARAGGGSRSLPSGDGAPIVESDGGDDPASGESLPVPDEVLGEDEFLRNFVDWDRVEVADGSFEIRFDLCAGSVPGLPALPGCPSGTGATIVPFDDTIDGEPLEGSYYVISNPAYPYANLLDPACTVEETFTITIVSNRPSTFSISAWNDRGSGRPDPLPAFDVATSLEQAAAWEEALDEEAGFGPRIVHCVELPDIDYGEVIWIVDGTSLYLPDGGATDSYESFSYWWNRAGGKPPSALIASTPETLYVRAWSRSGVSEQIYVQARPASPERCDNLGDIALVGSAPGSVQGIPDTVIPIDGDRTGWPWDPQWDQLEIHRLSLDAGVAYDVCIFWVNDTGPSFDPASVTRTESAQVVPPSPNNLSVYINGGGFADLGDDPRVNAVALTAILSGPAYFDPDIPTNACRGAWDTDSTAGRINFPVDGGAGGELCSTDDVISLMLQRGIQVIVTATDSLGDRYRRASWIPLSSNFFRCGAPCGEQSLTVHVPMPWVAPRQITGSFDWPFSIDDSVITPIDDDEAGQDGPPVGSLTIELVSSPTGAESRRWVLGDIGEVEQSDRRLPLRPQLDVTISSPMVPGGSFSQPGVHFPDGFPGLPHGIIEVRVEADRPVSLSAIIGESPLGALCLRNALPPSHVATTLATVHTFQLSTLCPLSLYSLFVDAADNTGTSAEIFGVGPADGTTPIPIGTESISLAVDATLALNSDTFEPGESGARPHLIHGDVYLSDPSGFRRPAVTRLAPVLSFGSESTTTGWGFNQPYSNVMCADPDWNDGVITSPTPLEGTVDRPGGFGDVASLYFEVRAHTAPTRTWVTPSGDLLRCTTGETDAALRSLSVEIDILDLLNGLSITSEDGSYTLNLQGSPRR